MGRDPDLARGRRLCDRIYGTGTGIHDASPFLNDLRTCHLSSGAGYGRWKRHFPTFKWKETRRPPDSSLSVPPSYSSYAYKRHGAYFT